MEIIRLIYWIGIAANKCVAKVVSLVRPPVLAHHLCNITKAYKA